ncbi:MAG: hypothetical protein MH137_00375 [Flavobacteriales bacterium]|nr:hypothetical protein [Flavobacteriales bacterium]
MNNLTQLKAKITFVVLAFSITGYFTLNHFRVEAQGTPEKKARYKLSAEDKSLLQNGDIIMRKGEGFVSGVINDIFNTGYSLSHCGIVLKDEEGKLKVIHTVSSELSSYDGVQTESIDKFVRESVLNTLIVVRYKADSLTRNQIAEASKSYLSRNKHFDHKFDINDTTEFYCTELIHYSFIDVFKKDMFPERLTTDHPDFLGLDAFLDPEKFDIILNHQEKKLP